MARDINDWPVEVIRSVLNIVRSEARENKDESFLNALTTCRLWHHIGEELLWTDIYLSDLSLRPFCASSCKALTMTRSLTVILFPARNDCGCVYGGIDVDNSQELSERHGELRVARATIWWYLAGLSLKIQQMPRLESFSLKVAINLPIFLDEESQESAFYLRGREIRLLLEALGPSVRHVELDDFCYITPQKLTESHIESNHICLSLKKLMPQLQNLRLRISPICEEMFPTPAPGSSEPTKHRLGDGPGGIFFLNTTGLKLNWDSVHCSLYPRDLDITDAEIDLKRHRICDFLVPYVRSAVAQHTVENFAQLSLLDIRTPPSRSRRFSHKVFDTVCERIFGAQEILRKTPFFSIITQLNLCGLRYLAEDGKTMEVIGPKDDVLKYCEGQAWVETVDDVRLANEYRKRHPRFQNVGVKTFMRWRKENLDNEPCTCRLWALEEEEGSVLVSGEIIGDLSDVACLVRIPTAKEVRREQRRRDIENGMLVGDDPDEGTWGDTDSEDFNDGSDAFLDRDHDYPVPDLSDLEEDFESDENDEAEQTADYL